MHLKKLYFCHERMAKALRTLDEFTFISCCGFPIFWLFCVFFFRNRPSIMLLDLLWSILYKAAATSLERILINNLSISAFHKRCCNPLHHAVDHLLDLCSAIFIRLISKFDLNFWSTNFSSVSSFEEHRTSRFETRKPTLFRQFQRCSAKGTFSIFIQNILSGLLRFVALFQLL